MALIYSLLTSVFLVFSANDVPYESIERAFENNDSKEIVALAKDKVLISVLGKEGVYSKSQASLVLKDFFSKKPDGSFSFYFKGKESNEGTFAIGNYKSRGEEFRVTIHFKKLRDLFVIESLTIEKS